MLGRCARQSTRASRIRRLDLPRVDCANIIRSWARDQVLLSADLPFRTDVKNLIVGKSIVGFSTTKYFAEAQHGEAKRSDFLS